MHVFKYKYAQMYQGEGYAPLPCVKSTERMLPSEESVMQALRAYVEVS